MTRIDAVVATGELAAVEKGIEAVDDGCVFLQSRFLSCLSPKVAKVTPKVAAAGHFQIDAKKCLTCLRHQKFPAAL